MRDLDGVPRPAVAEPGTAGRPRSAGRRHDERIAEEIFQHAPLALALVDLEGRFLRVNHALCTLLGYDAAELVGNFYQTLTHPADLELDAAASARLLEGGRGPTVEKRFRQHNGELLWTRVTATLIRDDSGQPQHVIATLEDIDDRRRRDERLTWLALHDPLTGAANRALLEDRLDQALRNRDRDGGVVAVLYIDLDDFKQINDEHGHEIGDKVLVAAVERTRQALRGHDTLARVGGDELVAVAQVLTEQDAHHLHNRVRALLNSPLGLGGVTLQLRASVGLYLATGTGTSPRDAVTRADSAMYAVKRQRRDG